MSFPRAIIKSFFIIKYQWYLRALPPQGPNPAREGLGPARTFQRARASLGKAWGPLTRASPQANPARAAAWANDVMITS
ncbi:unnamed protein product [Prunus armeniaca]